MSAINACCFARNTRDAATIVSGKFVIIACSGKKKASRQTGAQTVSQPTVHLHCIKLALGVTGTLKRFLHSRIRLQQAQLNINAIASCQCDIPAPRQRHGQNNFRVPSWRTTSSVT
jgi:hypothetical protein